MDSKPLVLVVDDERSTVRLLEINLTVEGYEVMTAFDGLQALRRAWERPPDLIILDVLMPDVDGLEVVRRLRADPRTALVPIILLTARRRPEEVAQGWTQEIDLYLTKPYKVDDLLSMARRVLAAREEERRL